MLTNHMTIYLPVPSAAKSVVEDAASSASASSALSSALPTVAKTKVVHEILSRVVQPMLKAVLLPKEGSRFVMYRGFMLLGPPGVGKTFAVRAVQTLCRQRYGDRLRIDVVSVSIPELLSSEDPVGTLRSILPALEAPKVARKASAKNTAAAAAAAAVATVGSSKSTASSAAATPVSSTKSGFSFRSPSTASSHPATPVAHDTPQLTASPQKGFSFSASRLHQPLPSSSSKASPVPTKASSLVTPGRATAPARPLRLAFFVVDEIDALGHRHRQNDVQIALKQLLCDWLDRLQQQSAAMAAAIDDEDDSSSSAAAGAQYAMIATSNRSEDVDQCFRRGGRLEQEINVLLTKDDRKSLWRSYLDPFVVKLHRALEATDEAAGAADAWSPSPSSSVREALVPWLRHLVPLVLTHATGRPKRSPSLLDDDDDGDEATAGAALWQRWLDTIDVLGETSGGYVAADIAAVVADLERQVFPLVSAGTGGGEGALHLPALQQLVAAHSGLAGARHTTSAAETLLLTAVYATMRQIPPSCLRGVSLTTPKLSLDDVIGHRATKLALQRVLQFTNPRMQPVLRRFGLHDGLGGVLLYGPPGNSKTRLVAAIASSYHLPLLSLSSADVYSAYVGDAEAEVRRAFALARQAAPCILFFDELDSLVLNRAQQGGGSSSSSVEARVLSTFLNEMDGVSVTAQAAAAGILVMAATNRIDCIDAALLRKGRFYQSIYVAPPDADDRRALMHYFGAKAKLPAETIERLVAAGTWEGMSGADVENVCKEAAMEMFQQRQRELSPPPTSTATLS
jgi:SpoVK/Ycf46/Vps4 family AAA+-type ATPase